jgi:hypothetical protein
MSDLIARISQQQRIADQIRDLQKEERELRSGILEECFGMEQIGVQKTIVGNLLVTGEYGLSYKFDQEPLDGAIQDGSLSQDALNSIRVKYELDKRVYDQLPDEVVEELSHYLTIKPTLPTLKIKEDVDGE